MDGIRYFGKIKPIIILFVFFILSRNIYSQYTNTGADPSSLKWNIAKTKHYKLIYPQGYDSVAYRYAVCLEMVYPHQLNTINSKIKKEIPVIFHPKSMLSNGLVVWAPKRMELITTPSPHCYPQSWHKQLTLHESRHVIQMEKLLESPFNISKFVGEQSSAFLSLGVPKWFFEGDAVSVETGMSNSGRGRNSEFSMPFRAALLSNKSYSFDKWNFGSYKDFTGNHYLLGYHLTSYARYKYGKDIWNKVLERYTHRIFHFPSFSNALKHHTGLTTKKLYNQASNFLYNEWKEQDSINNNTKMVSNVEYLTAVNIKSTSYRNVQLYKDSIIVAVKSSLKNLNSLIIIDQNIEKRLTYLGNLSSRVIVKGDSAYWTEYTPGKRWQHENYSDLKIFNIKEKKIIKHTSNKTYLAPAVSKKEKNIAVLNCLVNGNYEIEILNINNLEVIKRLSVPKSFFVKEMIYDFDENLLITAITDNGLGLYHLNTEFSEWKEILEPKAININSISLINETFIFESGFNGVNNIYALNINNGKINRLTNSRFGAFDPILLMSKKKLYYSDYQVDGYKIATIKINIDSIDYQPYNSDKLYKNLLAETLRDQENFNIDTIPTESINFNPIPYNKNSNLFNIHSWAPFYFESLELINPTIDNISTAIKPGAMVISQNDLSTLISQAGWYYESGRHHAKFSLTYLGFFPVINMNMQYGGKATNIYRNELLNNKYITYGSYSKRNYFETEANIRIPINLTKSYYIHGLQPSLKYMYTNDRYQNTKKKMKNFQYALLEFRHYYYRKMALRDIIPRLGYQVRLQILHPTFSGKNFNNIYTARLTTYIPGIRENDTFMTRFIFQFQDINKKSLYVPLRLLEKPRGYDYIYQTRTQTGIKMDYSFNITYPDQNIYDMLYLKRIRANIFYDIIRNKINNKSSWQKQDSFGVDVITDCNVFRFHYPFNIGARITKPINYGKIETSMLLSLTF